MTEPKCTRCGARGHTQMQCTKTVRQRPNFATSQAEIQREARARLARLRGVGWKGR